LTDVLRTSIGYIKDIFCTFEGKNSKSEIHFQVAGVILTPECPINIPGRPGSIEDDPEDVLCCLGFSSTGVASSASSIVISQWCDVICLRDAVCYVN